MNSNNKKIILIASGAVILILLVLAGVLLFRGIRQFGVAEQNLANARTQLDGFYKRDPFPNSKNIAVTKDNTTQMKEWMTAIVDVAKRKQVDPAETRSPSVFINTLGKIRNSLQSKARQEGVVIDQDFGFGFDRYVAGQPATADHVPRLIQQLLIVNEICNVLIEEKAKELLSVYREPFEGAVSTAPVRGRRARPSRRPASSRGNATVSMSRAASLEASKANPMAGEFEEDAIDAKTKFAFDFVAKESALISILNRLALNEMFIVVTAVDIETPQASPKEEEPKKRVASSRPVSVGGDLLGLTGTSGAASGEEGAPAAATPTSGFKRTPSREERVVFGGKVEEPSKIHLELEVYRFK